MARPDMHTLQELVRLTRMDRLLHQRDTRFEARLGVITLDDAGFGLAHITKLEPSTVLITIAGWDADAVFGALQASRAKVVVDTPFPRTRVPGRR
jgi:hypothetical protein